MKKLGTIRKSGLTLITLLVCLALCVSCLAFGFVGLPSARAEVSADNAIFDKISVPAACSYGESFDISAVTGTTVKVIRPDGTEETLGAAVGGKHTVTAKQVGNYTVEYSKGETASYSFNVHVTLDESYFLKVDHDGADIPSTIQKDGKFEIPGAKVVYYDDNDILREYPGKTTLSVVASKNKKDGDNKYKVGDTFVADSNGKVYLTYTAVIGDDGNKQFSQTFTINVQSTYTDKTAPSLVINGISNTVSVNRAVTLPKASASDNFDERVKVDITVTDKDGERVRVVDVDKNGYASQDADKLAADKEAEQNKTENYVANYPYIEFDNDKAMTFYPIKDGRYTVTYVAYDDAGNKSSERVYYITASDLASPIFDSIDDYMIPDTWGYKTVKNANNDFDGKPGVVKFPIPTLVDNKDHVPTEGDESENLIGLYFRVTDKDNNKTVFTIQNVFAKGDDAVQKKSDTYGDEGDTEFKFENGILEFDFNKYNKKDSDGNVTENIAGTYTVLYRAKDKAGNTSSKSYTITLQEDYVDDAAPATVEVDVPAYISGEDKELLIPSPIVSDASDKRLDVTYELYTDDNTHIAVNGGETATFETRSDGRYLVIEEDDKALKLGDALYFYIVAKDDVGNVTYNTKGNVANYKESNDVVKIIAASDAVYSYTGAIEFPTEKIVEDKLIKVGGFKIDTTYDMRSYTGFEVQALSPDGDAYNVTLDTFTVTDSDAKTATIYVKNIEFRPSEAGKNSVLVRVFDVNGVNSVYAYEFDVAESVIGGGVTEQAVNVPTVSKEGNSVNVKYKLHNETIKVPADEDSTKKYYAVRRISGSVFALMGTEITAKQQGTYLVYDGYAESGKLTGALDSFDFEDKNVVKPNDRYSFGVTDSAAPVIEIQGEMPAYAAKDAKITLPSVFAYSEYGNATVDLKVTDKSGKPVDTDYDEDTNTYSFVGTVDGAYTATYTATYANASPVSVQHTINVGDVEGPEFKYVGGTTGRQTAGTKFTFGKIELTDSKESTTGLTITKKLIDPSKEEVSSATVHGSFSTYKDDEDNKTAITLDKNGEYEVVYTLEDAVGNKTVQSYTITVVRSGSATPTTFTAVSTTLIIVAVVLLAGVIVYVVRFRKVKK